MSNYNTAGEKLLKIKVNGDFFQNTREHKNFDNSAWNHHAYGCFMVNDGHNRVQFNNSNHSGQNPHHNELMVCKRV